MSVYWVRGYISGQILDQVLQTRRFTEDETLDVLEQVLEALQTPYTSDPSKSGSSPLIHGNLRASNQISMPTAPKSFEDQDQPHSALTTGLFDGLVGRDSERERHARLRTLLDKTNGEC